MAMCAATFFVLLVVSVVIVGAFALAQVLLSVNKWRTRNSPPSTNKLPPGPRPWPTIGSLHELIRQNPRSRWVQSILEKMNVDIACIRVGNVHIIPVSCPVMAREFLKIQDMTFATRPVTRISELSSFMFKSVAVTPTGDQWKKMRTVIASEFLSPSKLNWSHQKREEEADNLVRYVYNLCIDDGGADGAVMDVRFLARTYVGNVVRRLVFNKRYLGNGRSIYGGPTADEIENVEAVLTMLKYHFSFCISDYFPCLAKFDLDGHEKVVKNTMKILSRHFDPIIDERLRDWRGGDDGVNCPEKEPEDFLDVMISLKDDKGQPLLSTDEIKAQTADIHYASIDNMTNAVEWAMAEMMSQPEILRKAVDEIDNVVGKDRLVQESDIPKLNYVKACVREALRLHPASVFNLPHVSNADAIVGGYFIPKGSHVLLSRIGLGRNPKVWDQPLKFNPQRHFNSDQIELSEPNLRFISFSTGRRGCIGGSLATAVTIMLISRLLQGFQWSTRPGDSSIDLSDSPMDMFMVKPLHLHAMPRLSPHLYPPNNEVSSVLDR